MNEQLPVNRVEMELAQWRSREERFSKLFSFNLSNNKSLLKEKLKDYERIASKYKSTQNIEEQFAIRILKQENRKILKQIYPNYFIRFARKILIAPLTEQIVIRQDLKELEQNSQSLHEQLQRIGFPDLSAPINKQIAMRQKQFNIPLSYYISEKEKIDHQLSFFTDTSGRYQFEGYKTVLQNESKPEEKRDHFFKLQDGDSLNITQAYNLLAGRAIQNKDSWIQLNLNDKDSNGNYNVKEFYSNYGYDLDKTLKQLPIKELSSTIEADKLKNALKQGKRQSVTLTKDGNEYRFYIEANPQFKSINIYDEHSRKVTIQTALGNKTAESLIPLKKVNELQEENQIKRSRVQISI